MAYSLEYIIIVSRSMADNKTCRMEGEKIMFGWLILYLILGSTLFKVVSDVNAIMKGTYVKKKTRQLLWKQVRKYRK